MLRVYFQNGPDASSAIILPEQYETEAEARKQLPQLVQVYGTVDDAAAWLEGDKPPKHLAAAEAEPEPEPEAEEPGEVEPIGPNQAVAQPVGEEAERDAHAAADLDGLTHDELDELADANEVADYPKSANKDEKIAALQAAGL